ncbi:MAG: HAD family hydrolase, partial [Treponema sp.]|nr:HAD family hydrolase [Treponema sp.]
MNTVEELAAFKSRKDFFIGIDSDGTAFNSMNIKHRDAFLPAALEVWDFGDRAGEFRDLWERINLYSPDRGINRFAGLASAFEKLRAAGAGLPDPAPLRDFVESGGALSNTALRTWMAARPHPFLDETLRWSLRSDILFEEHTRGLPPFGGVKEAIRRMAEKADIMVISSASGKSLDRDWSSAGLTPWTALVAGQEAGSKKNQLRLGAQGKYPPRHILMIGDAPGDMEAADAVEALFYPIIPGKEEQSWTTLG